MRMLHAELPMPEDANEASPKSLRRREILLKSLQHRKILLKSLVKLGDELERAFDSERDRKDVEYERARYIHAIRAIGLHPV
jgi:hypothetical protein